MTLSDDENKFGPGGENVVGDQRECPVSACNDTQGYAADPINTRTGGFSFTTVDFSLPTPAGPLVFQRSYASPATALYSSTLTTLGVGWTHNQDTRLVFEDDPGGTPGTVWFKAHTANQFPFTDHGDGTFTAQPGVLASLTYNAGNAQYTLVNSAQAVYTFDADGKLLSWADAEGHLFSYSYDAGRLSQVSEPVSQRYLAFTYNGQGQLAAVGDSNGRQVTFAYDANGDLTAYTDLLGQTWQYTYDAHRLTKVIDPQNVARVETLYDAQGRAWKQFDGEGNQIFEAAYTEDSTGKTTVFTDGKGNENTHFYDLRNTLITARDAFGNDLGKTYADSFRPEVLTDRVGHPPSTLTWSTDGANLEHVEDALGYETTLTYDSLNNLISKVDPRTYLTTYTYEGTLLKTVTDALNFTTVYTYTPEGYLEAVEDPLHHVTEFSYNTLGQLTSKTDALDHTTTYAYDSLGRLMATTDPLGRVTRHVYDLAGRLVRVTENVWDGQPQNHLNEYNRVTEYEYDENGNRTLVRDTLGRETRHTYDNNNRLIKIEQNVWDGQPQNHLNEYNLVTVYTYDENGNLHTVTDTFGRVTRNTYDANNRLEKIEQNVWDGQPQNYLNEYNIVTEFDYDANGNQTHIIDTYGHVTFKEYDELNRVERETRNYDPNYAQNYLNEYNLVTEYAYDEVGNLIQMADTLGRITTYEYDALNHLIKETDPELGVTEHFYDGNGNRIQTIDPNGNPTTYEYDELNRLRRVIDAYGNDIVYEYDEVGNRLSVTDQNDHTTTYTYDGLNRELVITDPLLNPVKTTGYDPLGNVISVKDALNRTYTYQYDSLNRVKLQIDPELGETSFTYDALGNRLTVTDANTHPTTFTYDTLNRLTVVTDPNNNPVSSTMYDALGNVLATADALGNMTSYAYDGLSRQISMTDPLLHTTQYGYNPVSDRVAVTDANGVVTSFEYDTLHRLTAVIENYQPGVNPTSEINVQTQFTYDHNGNLLTVIDANRYPAVTYTYDALNRMATETDALTNTWTYAYDAVGNQIGLFDANEKTTLYVYDARNLLTSIDYPTGTTDVAFAYNAAGERISMTDGTGATTWVYDDLSRPTSITAPLVGTVGYGYDDVGNRTSLSYPGGKTILYSYDPANRLETVSTSGGKEGNIAFYGYDLVGRVTQATLGNGVVSTYTYDDKGQLANLSHAKGGNTYSSFAYTYDEVGNRLTASESLEPSDLLFTDGFESGNFSAWSSVVSDTELQVTPGARLAGNKGLSVSINDTEPLYVQDDTPNSETEYRARFYVDPNSITMATNNVITLLNGYNPGSSLSPTFIVQINKISTGYVVKVRVRKDDGTLMISGNFPITDAPHAIEIHWKAATAPGANNGSTTLWMDGVQKYTLTAVDNDLQRVDYVRFGAVTFQGTSNGTICLDAFESRKQKAIGLLSGVSGCTASVSNVLETEIPSLTATLPLGTRTRTSAYTAMDPVPPQHETQPAENQALTIALNTPELASITYEYDPLNRLTDVFYGGIPYFGYTYDAVGNRLTETLPLGTNTYAYDAANRLTSINGNTITWDNNGNLLQDNFNGVTYTYNAANQLITHSKTGTSPYTFTYNGLGERVLQTANFQIAVYTLDLAAGLSQVLADGTNTYFYGLGRVAQRGPEITEYFLTDAIGSVRQLANQAGNIDFLQSYEPFGAPFDGITQEGTPYGFAGEWTDATGLQNLRARYYAPTQGRFLTRDTFAGLYTRPASLHRYTYAENNPVLYTDPSGHCVPACILVGGAILFAGALILAIPYYDELGNAFGDAWKDVEATCDSLVDQFFRAVGKPYVIPQPQFRPTGTLVPYIWTPSPTSTPSPTNTPEPEQKDISLGRHEWLWPFTFNLNEALNPQNIYVYTSGEWFDEGLSETGPGNPFGPRFQQAIERARHIHFNLEGIPDPNQYAEAYGNFGVFSSTGYYTATELFIIKHNGWCHKTSFYENGGIIPSASAKSSICGNQ